MSAFTTSLEGTWNLVRKGKLKRRRVCVCVRVRAGHRGYTRREVGVGRGGARAPLGVVGAPGLAAAGTAAPAPPTVTPVNCRPKRGVPATAAAPAPAPPIAAVPPMTLSILRRRCEAWRFMAVRPLNTMRNSTRRFLFTDREPRGNLHTHAHT